MKKIILSCVLVAMSVPTAVALGAEEAGAGGGESVVGLSNLILLLGIGAVVVVAVALRTSKGDS